MLHSPSAPSAGHKEDQRVLSTQAEARLSVFVWLFWMAGNCQLLVQRWARGHHRSRGLFTALPGWQGVELEIQALTVRAVCCALGAEDGYSLPSSRTLKKMAVKVGQCGQKHDKRAGVLVFLP